MCPACPHSQCEIWIFIVKIISDVRGIELIVVDFKSIHLAVNLVHPGLVAADEEAVGQHTGIRHIQHTIATCRQFTVNIQRSVRNGIGERDQMPCA